MKRSPTKTSGGPPAEERKLHCLNCGHTFFSGNFFCPSCLQTGMLVEPDAEMLRDLELLPHVLGRKAKR